MPFIALERPRHLEHDHVGKLGETKETEKIIRFAEGPMLVQTIEVPLRSPPRPDTSERSAAKSSIPIDLLLCRGPTPQTTPQEMSRIQVLQPDVSTRSVPNASARLMAGGASNFLPERAPAYCANACDQAPLAPLIQCAQTFTLPCRAVPRCEPVPSPTGPSCTSLHFDSSGILMEGDGVNTTSVRGVNSHPTAFGCPPEVYTLVPRSSHGTQSDRPSIFWSSGPSLFDGRVQGRIPSVAGHVQFHPDNDDRVLLLGSSGWYGTNEPFVTSPPLLKPVPHHWTCHCGCTPVAVQAQAAPLSGPSLGYNFIRCAPNVPTQQGNFNRYNNVPRRINPFENPHPTSPRTPPPRIQHAGCADPEKDSKGKSELEKVVKWDAKGIKVNGNLKAEVQDIEAKRSNYEEATAEELTVEEW